MNQVNTIAQAKGLAHRIALYQAQLTDLARKAAELEAAVHQHIHDLEDQERERRLTTAA